MQPDDHARAVATIRAFGAESGAERVVLLLDRGADRGAVMVEWLAGGAVEVTEGEETTEIPSGAPVPATAEPIPHVHAIPATAIEADPDSGRLSAPLGAIPALGAAVRSLARAFGGRSVATAEFATRDPELPITIAAREGDALLVAVGEQRFELPEGA